MISWYSTGSLVLTGKDREQYAADRLGRKETEVKTKAYGNKGAGTLSPAVVLALETSKGKKFQEMIRFRV